MKDFKAISLSIHMIMEKLEMTVDQLRAMSPNWKTGSNNSTILAAGEYQFGVITEKEATIVQSDGSSVVRKFPLMEVVGHGTISMTRLLASKVASEEPTLARTGNYYFPQVPVNTIFAGELAVIACGLQNKKVKLAVATIKQQSGFPLAGHPWKTPEEAKDPEKGGRLVPKTVYQIMEVLN